MKNEQNNFLSSLKNFLSSLKSSTRGISLIYKTSIIIIVIPILIIAIITFVFDIINTKDYKKIDANVIETNKLNNNDHFDYEIKIEYIVNNITYQQTIDEDQSYKIGDKITIKYNPENPNEFSNNEQFSVMIILIFFIILFGSILILFIKIIKLSYKSIKLSYIRFKKLIKAKITPSKEIGAEYIEEIRKEENKWKQLF